MVRVLTAPATAITNTYKFNGVYYNTNPMRIRIFFVTFIYHAVVAVAKRCVLCGGVSASARCVCVVHASSNIDCLLFQVFPGRRFCVLSKQHEPIILSPGATAATLSHGARGARASARGYKRDSMSSNARACRSVGGACVCLSSREEAGRRDSRLTRRAHTHQLKISALVSVRSRPRLDGGSGGFAHAHTANRFGGGRLLVPV